MDNGYIVRFVRADTSPNEEYFYHRELDARYHFELFKDDNSGLYRRIELCPYDDPGVVMESICFD